MRKFNSSHDDDEAGFCPCEGCREVLAYPAPTVDAACFVYRARPPFDPGRLHEALRTCFAGAPFARGIFWLATRPDLVGGLAVTAGAWRAEGRGRWWSAMAAERWPDRPDWARSVAGEHHPLWGDRRQEIVVAGADAAHQAAIRHALDGCLVAEGGWSPAQWRDLSDPFPPWPASIRPAPATS